MLDSRLYWMLTFVLLIATGCGESDDSSESVASESTPNSDSSATTAIVSEGEAPPFPAGAVAQVDDSERERAEELLESAEQSLKSGQANEALKAISRAITLDPKRTDAYVRRADLLSKSGLTAQAIADMSRALKLDPRNAKLFNTRGYLHLSRDDIEESIEDFNRAIALNLEYPQPYNNRGLARISQGDSEKAIYDFDAALRIDPEYIDAHNNRGYALSRLDRHDEAITSLSKAIELNPEYVNAWNNRGLVHKDAGQMEKALIDFNRAVELDSSSRKYLLHRAEVYDALDRKAEAATDRKRVVWLERLVHINRAVATNPEDAQLWVERARLMIEGDELSEAHDNLERVAKLNPNLPEIYRLRAQLAFAQDDYEAAVQHATEAIEREDRQEAYSLRGDAYFKLQNYESALSDYRVARRLDSQVQQALELRAAELEKDGQADLAGHYRQQASAIQRVSHEAPAVASESEPPPFPTESAEAKPIVTSSQPSTGDGETEPKQTVEAPESE